MAVDAYTGLPRSGKSYSVVKNVILPSLREGRHVYTNIPMTELAHQEYPEHIHQLAKDWFSSPDLADLFPAGSVVVLDELWRRWPSGMKANVFPFKDKEFLAEHGHNVDENGNTTRVVLVTQDLADIAAFARGKVDKTYRSQKLDAVGADNRFRVDIYEGSITGQRPPKSQFIRSIFDKYEEKVYRYYRSSTKSKTGDVGNEKRADKRANIWRSKFMWFCLVAPVVGIPLLLTHIVGLFSSGIGLVDEASPKPGLQQHQPAPSAAMVNPLPADLQPAPGASVVPSKPAGPVLSTVWRVVGSAERSKDKTRDPAGWDSQLGYNVPEDPVQPSPKVPDLVILSSHISGLRYVPASDCERYPDGVHWHCMIDGELVTPWSGSGGSNEWARDGERLVGRTVQVATDQPEAKVDRPPKG